MRDGAGSLTARRPHPATLPRPGLGRRGALGAAAWAGDAGERRRGARPGAALEREHLPVLRVPRLTTNGAKVPIVVELAHPMTPDHHITSVHVANEGDPIPSKGTFHLTPANGRVHLAFQARMHEGVSEVTATVECNRHGRWSARSTIEIPAGAGGCGGSARREPGGPAATTSPGRSSASPSCSGRGAVRRGRRDPPAGEDAAPEPDGPGVPGRTVRGRSPRPSTSTRWRSSTAASA